MKLCGFIFMFIFYLCSATKIVHEFFAYNGCSDDGNEDVRVLDGDEEYHTDFNKGDGVMTLPEFADYYSDLPSAYDRSVHDLPICSANLHNLIILYNYPPEELDPPQTSVYPKDDIKLGVQNKLICLATGFFPPPVRVFWTKNDKNVTEDVYLSQYYPNSEYTFTFFSTLVFTPQDGDIYTCTVEHRSLQQPQTRTYDVQDARSSDGALIFCGVAMTIGLASITAGIVLFIKGRKLR